MKEKVSFVDRVGNFSNKIAQPLLKIANIPAIDSIQRGLIQTMPIIIVGSIFLILYVLGSPSVGDSGKALLPFLEPYANKLAVMNSLTIGFLALYASVTITMNYAEKLGIDMKTAAVLGLATFVIVNLDGTNADGFINPASFGATK